MHANICHRNVEKGVHPDGPLLISGPIKTISRPARVPLSFLLRGGGGGSLRFLCLLLLLLRPRVGRWCGADSGVRTRRAIMGCPFPRMQEKGNAASEFLERQSLDPRHRLPTIDGDSLATNMRKQFSHLCPWCDNTPLVCSQKNRSLKSDLNSGVIHKNV